MTYSIWRGLALALALSAGFSACDSAENDDEDEEPTPAERLCNTLRQKIQSCGSATPCDEAMVKDCASIAGIMSDPYLAAATKCIEAGGVPQQCFVDALSELKPTAAHQAFGEQFCSECLLGVPGCVDTLFSGGDGEGAIAGKIIMPFGDALVGELASECASGLTCAATFLECAKGVIIKRAIPDNTLQCLLDTLTGNVEPGMESDCSTSSSSASGGGMACLDAEQCASGQVCDANTQRCIAAECAMGSDCPSGELCLVQIPMSDTGACYAGCAPFGAGGCAADQTCIDATGEGTTGVCFFTGTATLGQPCEDHDVSSGCVAGQFCADQGQGNECLEQCDFWGGTGTCSDSSQSCYLMNACIDSPYVDPVGVGQNCTSSALAGDMCAPAGDRMLGSCQDAGPGLLCYGFCRTAQSDCGPGQTCVSFGPELEEFGLCM
ncbi:MAG TPA: hypothetical protein VFB62_15120 [Polyangiaceae bacterium]|nr:hypothetical protein [Polyangiaceae bacterium]